MAELGTPNYAEKGGDGVKREDILRETNGEKERVYLRIDTLFHLGVPVSMREHKSGFPEVTIDCGDVHVLTDILSLEEWWAKRKQIE